MSLTGHGECDAVRWPEHTPGEAVAETAAPDHAGQDVLGTALPPKARGPRHGRARRI
jgi:hypothetical protein